MTETGHDLVPGDPQEHHTRATYRHALHAALSMVREVAERGAAPTTSFIGARMNDPPRLIWRAEPAHSDVDRALKAGWLVAVPERRPPVSEGSGRLAGLTVAVKDVIDVAGMPTRNGTPGGRWREPGSSAPAWQRLVDAGAACVGKAATHEMAWGVTTPQIPNPHDPRRVAGGSSGGSAACVAAGITQGALGTDTGGSIRIPAALCGVVGIRPTHGTVPLAGITPLAPSQDTVGPLGRDVATCAAMLEVLLDRPLQLPSDRLPTLRVGVLSNPGRLDTATAIAFEETSRRLERGGVVVVPCETETLRWAGAVSLITMLSESAAQHADAVRGDPHGFGGEARALLTLDDELRDQRALLAAARQVLRSRTAQLFADARLDAVLTPTTACVAPLRHVDTVLLDNRDVPVATALSRFTAWASATGLPAISVPVRTPGLPVGMQLMAPPDREDLCLLLAGAIEGRPSGPS